MNTTTLKRFTVVMALLSAALTAQAQSAAPAQGAPSALLVYADDETALRVTDATGNQREIYLGDAIRVGEILKTSASTAEIKLVPNGSVIKISRNTTFQVEALAGLAGKERNEFALLSGKIRAVAAKTSGTDKYQIRTRSAVCGVRGTDFTLIVEEGKRDAVFVRRGLVEFSRMRPDRTLATVSVGAGQYADALAQTFKVAAFTADQAAKDLSDLEFKGVDDKAVPQGPAIAAPPPPQSEPAAETAPAPAEPKPASSDASRGAIAAVPQKAATSGAAAETAPAEESAFMLWAKDMLGFEVGSVTINEKTYAKAVIQPTFKVGKLKMSLYLPVIYQSDLFNPNDWYHPLGNNEWSFGGEYWGDDPQKAAGDALTDLALKIRYIEYGNRYVDPLYLNIGNLNSMTIGHGALMKDFANDADFPAVRRIGLNTGYNAENWGAELVVNDLAEPEIYGGRIRFARFFGVSAIADIDPFGDVAGFDPDLAGDPIILGTALDFEVPLLKSEGLQLLGFADVAGVLPYNRVATSTVSSGLKTEALYDTDYGSGIKAFRNYGITAGFIGKMLIMDWRLEYRHFNGAYRPTFFNASYERNRAEYAAGFYAMLEDPSSAPDYAINGLYGEAGFQLLRDKITFTAGYMMPWATGSNVDWDYVMSNDYLLARLDIKRGVIPVLGLYGSLSYERTGFAYALMTDAAGVNLLDANTVFKGELVYPVSSGLSLAAIFATAAVRDDAGDLVYDSNANVKMEPTITFETRITF